MSIRRQRPSDLLVVRDRVRDGFAEAALPAHTQRVPHARNRNGVVSSSSQAARFFTESCG
jgi:hypothetical protein